MVEESERGKGNANLIVVACIVVVGALAGYLIYDNNGCVTKSDFGLTDGNIKLEFCTASEKIALKHFELAQKSYERALASLSAEDRDAWIEQYEKRMQEAFKLMKGEIKPMGPVDDAIREMLEPYLQ